MAIPNQTGTANSKASIWETALPRLGGAIPAESIRPNNMSHSRHTSLTERCSLMNNLVVAPSFNGRTADSGSAYRGSNPWGAANLFSHFPTALFPRIANFHITSTLTPAIARSEERRVGKE